jgi:alanyl-tRNA synthetase
LPPVLPANKYSAADARVHVGVLSSSGAFHKNVATQVVAACAIPNVVVHVTFRPQVAYLRDCALIETGLLSHGRFLAEVARLDALLYATMTECYPMVVLEAAALGVPVDDLVEGAERRSAEIKSLRDELKSLRKQLAGSQAEDLAASAVDGILVARVEADDRNEVRDLAVALRDRPGMRAVVLGSSPGGKGVALVAAVTPDSGLHASDLIKDAVALVGGGGGKSADLAAAGGKFPEKLDEALDLVRGALA